MNAKVALLVDDDTEIREAWRMALQDQKLEVLEAGDGAQALTILDERSRRLGEPRVDVIVSDWKMPRMDGATLLKATREKYRRIAFLLISGAMSREELQEAIRNGADAVLLKPFDKDALVRKIEEALFLREAKQVRESIR